MRRRIIAPFALAASLLAGATGCTLSAEIATKKAYEASDGVGAVLGDLALRNVLLITNDQGEANLVMTVVNSSEADVSLLVQYGDGASRTTRDPADRCAASEDSCGGRWHSGARDGQR